MDEVRSEVRLIGDDLAKLKRALVKDLPEEQRDEVFTMTVFSDSHAFEEFCLKLEDDDFKKLVVRCILYSYILYYCIKHCLVFNIFSCD